MTTKDKKTIEEQVKDKEEELLSEMLDEDPVAEDEVGETEQELEEEPEITIADIFSGFCKTEEEECEETHSLFASSRSTHAEIRVKKGVGKEEDRRR